MNMRCEVLHALTQAHHRCSNRSMTPVNAHKLAISTAYQTNRKRESAYTPPEKQRFENRINLKPYCESMPVVRALDHADGT